MLCHCDCSIVTAESLFVAVCVGVVTVAIVFAASEPNLKVKHKLKKHLNTRKSPLTRKESAPPCVKHRVPDTLGNLSLSLLVMLP